MLRVDNAHHLPAALAVLAPPQLHRPSPLVYGRLHGDLTGDRELELDDTMAGSCGVDARHEAGDLMVLTRQQGTFARGEFS